MTGGEVGMRNDMGLAVIVAINLAMFRDVTRLLAIPAIGAFVSFDLALVRLLIWARPIRPSEYGFMAAGFVATMITLPCNDEPHLLRVLIRLYRNLTGDARGLRFNNAASIISAERATLGVALVAVALPGAVLAVRVDRWVRRRADRLAVPGA